MPRYARPVNEGSRIGLRSSARVAARNAAAGSATGSISAVDHYLDYAAAFLAAPPRSPSPPDAIGEFLASFLPDTDRIGSRGATRDLADIVRSGPIDLFDENGLLDFLDEGGGMDGDDLDAAALPSADAQPAIALTQEPGQPFDDCAPVALSETDLSCLMAIDFGSHEAHAEPRTEPSRNEDAPLPLLDGLDLTDLLGNEGWSPEGAVGPIATERQSTTAQKQRKGTPVRRNIPTDEQVRSFPLLLETRENGGKGMTYREVAEMYGCHPSSVRARWTQYLSDNQGLRSKSNLENWLAAFDSVIAEKARKKAYVESRRRKVAADPQADAKRKAKHRERERARTAKLKADPQAHAEYKAKNRERMKARNSNAEQQAKNRERMGEYYARMREEDPQAYAEHQAKARERKRARSAKP